MNLPGLPFITKLTAIFLVTLYASQSAYAFNLNLGSNITKQFISKPTLETSSNHSSSLLFFEEKNILSLLNGIKDNYLTFYSDKNAKIKATYVSGAYYLNYSNEW